MQQQITRELIERWVVGEWVNGDYLVPYLLVNEGGRGGEAREWDGKTGWGQGKVHQFNSGTFR